MRLCKECETTPLEPWQRGHFCAPCSEMLSNVTMPALLNLAPIAAANEQFADIANALREEICRVYGGRAPNPSDEQPLRQVKR